MTNYQDPKLVPGQLHNSERFFLKDIAIKASAELGEDLTIVNIGIWKGASCHCLRIGAPKAQLIGIDVMGTYPFETPGLLDFLRMRVIKRNSNYIAWQEPIHLLFIDGGHEHEVVAGDIRLYCPYVVSGGYVVFHDSRRDEVFQAIDTHIRSVKVWEELTTVDNRVGTLAWFRRS